MKLIKHIVDLFKLAKTPGPDGKVARQAILVICFMFVLFVSILL